MTVHQQTPKHYEACRFTLTEHQTPKHYVACRVTIEPADLTQYLPHPLGSAIEYILRSPFKGQKAEDLHKAAYWLRRFAYDDEWCIPRDDGFVWIYAGRTPQHFRACAACMCALDSRIDGIFFFEGSTVGISRNAVEKLIEELEAQVEELRGER